MCLMFIMMCGSCDWIDWMSEVSVFDACAARKGKLHLPSFLKLLFGDGARIFVVLSSDCLRMGGIWSESGVLRCSPV